VHDICKAGKTSTPLVEIDDEHNKSINAAFVSGDGEIMVSVSLDNTVWTWSNFILPGSKPACEVRSCHLETLYTVALAFSTRTTIFVFISSKKAVLKFDKTDLRSWIVAESPAGTGLRSSGLESKLVFTMAKGFLRHGR
jgi:hypothetical protein